MVHFEHRAWQILIKFEKLSGFWPFHSKMRRLAVKICVPLLKLSCTAAVLIRVWKEWNVNIDIVIENILLSIMHLALMIKFGLCMQGKSRREIFEQVATRIETIVEKEETAVLNSYYNKALTLLVRYAAFFAMGFAIYDTLPVARMFFVYFVNNGTLERQLPFHVDYLVDEQEYFMYILVHLTISVAIGITIEFAFELYYFLIVRHVCALFKIVRLRLNASSEIFNQCAINDKVSDSDEEKAFKIITSAVVLHSEAIQLADTIDENYRKCWFIVLFLNMACLAPLPIVMVMIYFHNPFELFRRSVVLVLLVAVLVHFYVVFLQGQMIMDYSSSVYDACYNFCWYNSSKRCRVAISIMMMRSFESCRLTGLLFDLSMATYCAILKTALSYISMFTALDITAEY